MDEREERTKKEQDSLIVVDRWEAEMMKKVGLHFAGEWKERLTAEWKKERMSLAIFPFTMSRWKNETWGETVALKLSSKLFLFLSFFFLPTFSLLFHRKLHSLHLINDINGRCSPAVAIADCDMGCPALCILSLSFLRICTFLSLHQFPSAVSVWRRG